MIYPPKNLTTTFVVYSHEFYSLKTKQFHLAYVGCCRLDQIVNCPDARRNTEWRKIASNPEYGKLRVEIISTHTTLESALIAAGNCSVVMNAPIKTTPDKAQSIPNFKIMCLNDGEKFISIAKAADNYGVHRTGIQNHLAGRYGYTTVKGYRFMRIDEPVHVEL
jgi:hypothetical protein